MNSFVSCQVSPPSSFHPEDDMRRPVLVLLTVQCHVAAGFCPVTSTQSLHHHRSKRFMPSAAAVRGGVCMWVCVQMWRQIELNLIAFIFALLTISRKHSNPSSPHLPHHWCHSNLWATNWFSLPRWFPYQADCQHGRWEAFWVALLLQQIWWIAQTVSSSPVQTCSRGGTFSHAVQYCVAHRVAYWV